MSNEHTTHQGAEGAETMTAGDPDINEFGRVVWHSSDEDSGPDVGVTIGFGSGRALWFGEISKKMREEEGAEAAELGSDLGTWIILYDDNKPRGEQATVIGKAIPYVGTDVCDAISASLNAALSTPAPRTDGGMTAGEGRIERVTRAILDWRGFHYAEDPMEFGQNAYDITNEARAEAIAVLNALGEHHVAPAQPAGAVPDSLREAIEGLDAIRAEEQQRLNNGEGCRLYRLTVPQSHAETLALEFVRTLLASQPAGQSAGSGAEPQRVERPYAYCCNMDPATCDCVNPNHGTALFEVKQPAPDSTRTCQGEAEELNRRATAMIRQCFARAEIPEEISKDTLRAAAFLIGDLEAVIYAARPAAPEAQGTWVEIDDEARDGSHWLVARPEAKPARAFFRNGAWWLHGAGPNSRQPVSLSGEFAPTHYQPLPAPPASSGQEGR